jgi:hypothetical protein
MTSIVIPAATPKTIPNIKKEGKPYHSAANSNTIPANKPTEIANRIISAGFFIFLKSSLVMFSAPRTTSMTIPVKTPESIPIFKKTGKKNLKVVNSITIPVHNPSVTAIDILTKRFLIFIGLPHSLFGIR